MRIFRQIVRITPSCAPIQSFFAHCRYRTYRRESPGQDCNFCPAGSLLHGRATLGMLRVSIGRRYYLHGHGVPAGITWLHRDGSVAGISSRGVTMDGHTAAVPNSSTGSAGRHASDSRLSPSAVTPQKPLRSAGRG